MSFQGNVEGHVFQKEAWRPLIFMFYFNLLSSHYSVCKKLEKLTHNFNYTHTSLIAINHNPHVIVGLLIIIHI